VALVNQPIPIYPPCPYCGSPTHIQDSAIIYHGQSFGLVLICTAYPKCDAFVGCHQQSGQPKGTLANAELRKHRKEAHAAFDPIWRSGCMYRQQAYRWLAGKLGIEREACHIGQFSGEQCQQVIAHCAGTQVRQ
jgi:hypothetical protein